MAAWAPALVVGLPDPQLTGHEQWLLRLTAEPETALDLAHALVRRADTSWVSLTGGGTEIVAVLQTPLGTAHNHSLRAAEQEPPRETGALRTRLLGQLLLGGLVPPAGELTRAGLLPNAEGLHHCFAADPADPYTLPALRAATAVVEGHLAGLCPHPPQPAEIPPGVLVVVAPAAPAPELRALYRLCVRALDIGRRQGREGRYDLTDFAAEIALAEQPLLGAYVSRELLGGLDPADGFHRQLALTALTYLDNGRRLDQTAAALFTHPNTVRYRLGRLREITAGSLNEPLVDGGSGPLHTLHWRWALTTWLEVSPRSA